MFGYIRVYKDELKVKEYFHFRAYYCGLCRELKNRYGEISRLLLNYDVTFLALFLSSCHQVKERPILERCIAHPFRKRMMMAENPYLAYAADLNVLLAYHNLRDNWMDDRSPAALSGMILLRSAYRRAARRHKEIDQLVKSQIEKLSKLEKNKCADLDEAADTFAKILEGLCPAESFSPAQIKAARWLSYNLGKWIYLIDAFDDLSEDIRKNKYNPYVYAYHYEGEGWEAFQHRIKPQAEFLLTYTLSQIGQSFEVLDANINKGILENIIYLGMKQQTDRVLNQRSCKKSEKLLRNSWCQRECGQGRNP